MRTRVYRACLGLKLAVLSSSGVEGGIISELTTNLFVKAIEYELHQKHGSVLVRVARGFNARVFARKYRKERTDACVIIQKIFRGWYQRERGKMRLATYKKWKAMAIKSNKGDLRGIYPTSDRE